VFSTFNLVTALSLFLWLAYYLFFTLAEYQP
jgi:hypothetical protein